MNDVTPLDYREQARVDKAQRESAAWEVANPYAAAALRQSREGQVAEAQVSAMLALAFEQQRGRL